jgi:hypothetical protein
MEGTRREYFVEMCGDGEISFVARNFEAFEEC